MAWSEDEFTGLLLEAARIAADAHDGQRRKSTEASYVLHPLRVAGRVAAQTIEDRGRHQRMILAAILHDTLEDTEFPPEAIEERFGAGVLLLVKDLTKETDVEDRAERRRRMLEHCGTMNRDAQLVKLADRLDNMTEMDGMPADFIARYCHEAGVMLDRLRGACPPFEQEIAELIERHSNGAGS